jgi:trehalose 6-phosphate synthase/phosphatase
MARLLIVSNRSPVTVRVDGAELHVEPSAGGLATGLKGPHERSGGLWIGWAGVADEVLGDRQPELAARLSELRIVPVGLRADEVERYYEGVCNGAIWPLFHYLVGQLPLEIRDFEVYEDVNARFADAVAAHHQSGDLIWVHDYQLMRVPDLIRQRIPDARIGFFLHIPFPSSELFRALPWREQILAGLLGADLIGFHAASYARHFSMSLLRVLGVATEVDRVAWQGRAVRLGVFPMGVDAAAYARLAEGPDVVGLVRDLRGAGDAQILVGIDRLDYTKGIPRRLLAFERMLERHPELRGAVRLIQVAVPSRTKVEAYQDIRQQVDGLVGRIHGAFATPTWTPIHYLFRSLSERDVVALYRAADVMLVTPIRDGMNLVAKEFVAARGDEGGVLVLSEFAGAASELAEAIHVNPYDLDGAAEAFHRAVTMASLERRTRMRALRRRVMTYDVHRWAETFLDDLRRAEEVRVAPALAPSPPTVVEATARRIRQAESVLLLLDYDGTLVPFAPTPELAAPDRPLLTLLHALAARARTTVHVVSGRLRDTLERWLGDLPVWLHAEHGVWTRPPGGEWTSVELPKTAWREPVLRILEDFTARTPGSLVEEKTASLAWHYRVAEPEFGAVQAKELMMHLMAILSNEPVELLPGDKVVEVRPHGLHKGTLVGPALAHAPAGSLVVALGDDRTDEDLFGALPAEAIAIHVGPQPSAAPIRLTDVPAARLFLRSLLEPA